jgi:hypothetical protein
MRKALTLTFLLLISTVCSQAESASPSSDKNQKSADLNTIQGCLALSKGQYTLTEGDGTIHLLAGNANKLYPQVGHEVELAGKPGTRTEETTSAGGASGANEFAVFEVKSVKHIADTCKPSAH